MTTTTVTTARPTAATRVTRNNALRDGVILAFRVVIGFLFLLHAIMAYGALGGIDGAGGAGPIGSFTWWVGTVQAVGAVLVTVGLYTRASAFLLSGVMAGAYFMVHQPMGALPIQNMGEQAALYSWIFLLLVAIGPGRYAFDTLRTRR